MFFKTGYIKFQHAKGLRVNYKILLHGFMLSIIITLKYIDSLKYLTGAFEIRK